ncbi:transposase [Nonomuraea sp. NPDC005730]
MPGGRAGRPVTGPARSCSYQATRDRSGTHHRRCFRLRRQKPGEVLVCIETDRGPWVRALVAAGYRVFGVSPKQAARHRKVMGNSGAKSDKADARALADMVRTRRHQLRQIADDSDGAEAVKVVARAHQTMI